jgi:NTP pyrophosphatase (non-canonical NTP hydrolase)
MQDDHTKVSELKEVVKTFSQERDWDQFHGPKDLAIGLVTEASELLEIFRFKSEQESKKLLDDEIKRVKVEDELSDILFFLLRFSERFKIDLSESLNRKIRKNETKYPIEKARGSNKKYDEF